MGVKLGLSHGGTEHRLSVCENRVLREIYGPKMEEEGGD